MLRVLSDGMPAKIAALLVGTVLALGTGGCRTTPNSERSAPATAVPAPAPKLRSAEAALPDVSAAPSAKAPSKLAPLASANTLNALPVEGHRDAVVSIPHGAVEPRPVVVALHGNYDRPEWQCEVWREVFQGFPFVVCPRGIPRGDAPKSEDRWTYGALKTTETEMFAAVDACKAKYAGYVDDTKLLFVGFSLGAILGKFTVRKHASRFGAAVFVEGGYEAWSKGVGERLAADSAMPILFACGQHACKAHGAAAARQLKAGGIEARVGFGGNIGHTYDGAVAKSVKSELAFLLAGDPRWKPVLKQASRDAANAALAE